MSYSPIIIFTYRRVPKKLIDSLLQNKLAKKSSLIIYSDGNKNNNDKSDIEAVRKYIRSITCFKSIKIIESQKNIGLANSIINGVTEVVSEYGKAIVLEDDLIVSTDFLDYMNDSLNFYENNKNIWSISGYAPQLSCFENYKKDLYLSPRGSSWGWATWQDRWDEVDWEVKDFSTLKASKALRKRFNRAGNDMYKMLELQMLGKIDSWAIRWCYSQFKLGKYTVYLKKSKIINDGFLDNIGTHNCGKNKKLTLELDNNKVNFEELRVENKMIQCFKDFHDLRVKTKIGYFLKKYGGYDFVKRLVKN